MAETNKSLSSVPDDEVQRQMRRLTRRSFACGAAAALTGLAGWEWLRSRELEEGIPWPFRRVLEFNEGLAQAYYRETRLAPTFAREQAVWPRVNGVLGFTSGFDAASWKLQVEGHGTPLTVTLDAIKALPRDEVVTELKCIEGWSAVVHWAGARLADFIAQCPLASRSGQPPDLGRPADLFEYISLETPGRGYYVGLDRASALHPQTLLCYEMNGEPLPAAHGAPLRLVTPLKYGIKNIKRIGTIRFSDQRPADYWAERGYDWYAGH
jgi:DMSO/TMAO reductase YedYZ molybdopterin-dependent catalytic subunit